MQEIPVSLPNNRPKAAWLSILRNVAIIVVIYLVITRGCIPAFQTGFGAETTYDPPGGDNAHFDPIAAADDIQAQVGEGAELMAMSATFVKSDGTQDLATDLYVATTNYEFVREVPPPADAPPIGAGGSADGRWYQVTDVDIFRPGQMRQVIGTNSYTYLHKGMDLDENRPTGAKPATIPCRAVPLPRCGNRH